MPLFKKSNLFYNFFSLGAVQLISSLLQLMVIPYVIRKIGADGFGVIAVAQVVMFYLSAFTEYGFSQTATRAIALHRSEPEEIRAIFSRVIFSRLFLCVIAFVLLLVLIYCIPVFRSHARLYCMAFVFVAGQSLLLTWFFQGYEKMHFIAFATLIARIIFVALVFTFIRTRQDDFLFLFFLGIGNVIAALFSIFVAIRVYRLSFIRPSWAGIRHDLRQGWQITMTNLSMNTCQYANIFVLRIFSNDLVVGYYSIAERIFFTIRQLFGIFSQAVYPRVCQLVYRSKEELGVFFRQVYRPFFVAVFFASFVLFAMAPWVLYFFMGAMNGNAVVFLRILCIASVIVCLDRKSVV